MTLPFKTIIVPTDFSELANSAIPVAFSLARDHKARVVLVHVLESVVIPNPLYATYYPIPTPQQMRDAEDASVKALKDLVPAEHRGKIETTYLATHGEPAYELGRIAREELASLIVISSHGRTGLKHLVLGSVAERVLRAATCPVLIMR
jgi:nucleotide-binding universal stress UspA family protein